MQYGTLTRAPQALPPDPTEQPPVAVGSADLPLSCPRADTPVWNLHPRVYLPIEAQSGGVIACPYCGVRYVLAESPESTISEPTSP